MNSSVDEGDKENFPSRSVDFSNKGTQEESGQPPLTLKNWGIFAPLE